MVKHAGPSSILDPHAVTRRIMAEKFVHDATVACLQGLRAERQDYRLGKFAVVVLL